MPNYEVRPATRSDAEPIATVHVEASHAAYETLSAGTRQLPMERRKAFWRDAIEYSEPQVQVALDQRQVIGFVGYDRSRDAGSKPTTGEIWALFIVPAHWGRGAGVALWDAAREGLVEEGCTEVTWWIPLVNERALRFAEKAGFEREPASKKTASMGGVDVEEIRLRRSLD
jgi:RimJ/RimL family protein N-acetyltransferase